MPPPFQPDTSTDLSAEIFGRVVRPMFSDDIADNAAFTAVAIDLIRRLCPRDPVEELLVAQMLWTHARAARLSRVSLEQKSLDWFKAYSAEFERSSNLFRRQMKAFDEHRKPRRRFVLTRKGSPALTMGPRAVTKKEIEHGPKVYRLSAAGLKSLRNSVYRNQPWCRSTGPKTAAGKAKSSKNRTTHGIYIGHAEQKAAAALLRELMRKLH